MDEAVVSVPSVHIRQTTRRHILEVCFEVLHPRCVSNHSVENEYEKVINNYIIPL
jgi:hypothetical protein